MFTSLKTVIVECSCRHTIPHHHRGMGESHKLNKIISRLLETNNDSFEVTLTLNNLKYEKKKGHMKPCVLVAGKVNVYILKEKTYELIHLYAIKDVKPVASDSRLVLQGYESSYTLYGASATELHNAASELSRLSENLAAPVVLKQAVDETIASPLYPQNGLDSSMAQGADWEAEQAALDEPTQTQGRRFLVNNIASADFLDYSAIRSVYPARDTEEKNGVTESKSLVKQLEEFIAAQQSSVEQVVTESAIDFMNSVENCDALQPHQTENLKQKVAGVASRVNVTTTSLLTAGQGVVKSRKEYSNVCAALAHIKLCHTTALLHSKAERLASESKYYPALLASQELEEKVCPLLGHAYGRWVFNEAIPALRNRIRASVQSDFNQWLCTAVSLAEPFGHKAIGWARERIAAASEDQRKVEHLEDDEDDDQSFSSKPKKNGGGSHVDTISFTCTSTEEQEDWADELVWDVQPMDTVANQGNTLGAAQFLEMLSDLMVHPQDEREQKLKVVHSTLKVFQCLDSDNGAVSMRKYYVANRKKQLTLILESVQSVADFTSDWLAKITGFFLVDLVVMQSTHPPLCHEYHVQSAWEGASECLKKWMFTASKQYDKWGPLLKIKSEALEVAVALEELWAVAGDSVYRLDPLYSGITTVRNAAMQCLVEETMATIKKELMQDRYLLISMSAKPDEDLIRRLFLHLSSSCTGGASSPKCSVTVLKVMDVMMNALDTSFKIHRGAGDVDEEVRGHIDSLLQHLASLLDERVGKLGKIHTLQIFIQSVNAGAYEAAALALSQKFATMATSTHVRDGRLRIFTASRKRLRDCQSRFEERGANLLRLQVQEYMQPLQLSMWRRVREDKGYTPLSDLNQYLISSWTKRQAMLPGMLSQRMQQLEIDEIDRHLVKLAQDMVYSDAMPHGARSAALKQLHEDVKGLEQASQSGVSLSFPSFDSEIQSFLSQSQLLDNQPAPPSIVSPTASEPSRKRGFTIKSFKKR
eukprot:TRINITY_DN3581_c1_g1_i1.p1 TRINITY_DN3581_c1_g1~~TRINITY_DN3581_c1_g1_i1.p1  ORF type:complete len:988 (+),score=311.76 TRINITY_DN3581_c1_g1_i1:413-3376(+)